MQFLQTAILQKQRTYQYVIGEEEAMVEVQRKDQSIKFTKDSKQRKINDFERWRWENIASDRCGEPGDYSSECTFKANWTQCSDIQEGGCDDGYSWNDKKNIRMKTLRRKNYKHIVIEEITAKKCNCDKSVL